MASVVETFSSANYFATQGRVCIGQITEINERGQALVDFPGNAGVPVLARSILSIARPEPRAIASLPAVLLAFNDNDERQPIIVGLLQDRFVSDLPEPTPDSEDEVDRARLQSKAIIAARDGIEFRCGHSSLELRRDGKILIKGKQIVSQASQRNRIQGGTVAIN